MMLVTKVWVMQARRMQAKAYVKANVGRDAGEQVPAGGCRGSVMGCSCQGSPRTAASHWGFPSISISTKEVGREVSLLESH